MDCDNRIPEAKDLEYVQYAAAGAHDVWLTERSFFSVLRRHESLKLLPNPAGGKARMGQLRLHHGWILVYPILDKLDSVCGVLVGASRDRDCIAVLKEVDALVKEAGFFHKDPDAIRKFEERVLLRSPRTTYG